MLDMDTVIQQTVWTRVVHVASADRRATQSHIYIVFESGGVNCKKGCASGDKEHGSGSNEVSRVRGRLNISGSGNLRKNKMAVAKP
ncbi:hypothetical protein P8452_44127 [Trifolium repens]|jgi:hypothetical protein|nr:hypothetical protein P8452_44127 [Trifolium repens]